METKKIYEPITMEMKIDFSSPSFLNSLSAPVSIPEINAPWNEIWIGSIPEKRRSIPQITVQIDAEIPPIISAAKALRHLAIRFLLCLGNKSEIENHEK